MIVRRANRSQLLEMEEGGLRSSAPCASSAEIAEQENERGLGELHDRVNILKRGNARNREEAAGARGVPPMVPAMVASFAMGAAVAVAVFLPLSRGAGAHERAPPPPPPVPLPPPLPPPPPVFLTPPPPPPIGSGATNGSSATNGLLGLLGLGASIFAASKVVGGSLERVGGSLERASKVTGDSLERASKVIGGPLGTVRVGHVEDMRPREIGESLFGRGRIGDVLSSVRIGSSPSSPPSPSPATPAARALFR
ncbi:hypothetical protein KC19_1G078700 [Ceratodon purpureus]|uniref:Uncharacterized protein n=1 Tax=Ceratodon purpureus TaxID=3225 RepID=A0A8T0J2Q0_CERPU|nr:hypothetical protein KC19_1G078700 [Ceratodon purpureus]KAG0590180.1 hypothetical protein KC19_1G078700 [Ceratodon purpureus]